MQVRALICDGMAERRFKPQTCALEEDPDQKGTLGPPKDIRQATASDEDEQTRV
jgi:hypothetical protein